MLNDASMECLLNGRPSKENAHPAALHVPNMISWLESAAEPVTHRASLAIRLGHEDMNLGHQDHTQAHTTAADPRDHLPKWLQFALIGLILYSTATVALETMPELSQYAEWFTISETVVVILFTIEYFTCWIFSGDRLRYPFRFMNLIDLAAILPFYLSFGAGFTVLRSLRLVRLLRLLKLARYNGAMQLLSEAFRRVGPELAMTGMLVTIAIFIAASALYFAEHDAQPEVYSSIPASMWWAITTLTTVGYGDVYPQTVVGRIVAAGIMLCGIGLVAIPSGLLASAMTEILRERRQSRGD
jgi:voltage-gated potassium channel